MKIFRTFTSKFSPVNIEYAELTGTANLTNKIEQGFGPSALGILTVSGVPGFSALRTSTLPLASSLAALSKPELQLIESPESQYSVGWSHGKESYDGVADYSKGSFYANPETDKPLADAGVYYGNLWPVSSLPRLEPAFKSLSTMIIQVGRLLAKHIDAYLTEICPGYELGIMQRVLTEQKSHVGRLLHYFPQEGTSQPWCG